MRKNNKKLKLFSLIFMILFVLASQTIVYSAINSTFRIEGDAYARAEADVRITDFRLATTNNATSNYEEFGKSHIVTEIDLLDSSSYITYYLEITNYGSIDIGIFDITGLPSGINYSIKDYNLHDKICDDSDKCNSFIKKTYEITLSTSSTYSGNVQLNFDFRTYHKVTYTDITNNNYPTEVIDGGNLIITFRENMKKVSILSNNIEISYYSSISNGQTITINNVTNDLEVKKTRPVAKLVSGNIAIPGSEICIENECFYVMYSTEDTVTMLAKYNLYVGGVYKSSGWTAYGDEATGLQDSTMLGVGPSTRRGVTAFSNKSNNYSESIVEGYVNNYSSYLTSLGVNINKARLVTKEELVNLGCVSSKTTCSDAPVWVYSTSYWTETAYNTDYIWYVHTAASFADDKYNVNNRFGVRPVIELSIGEIYIPSDDEMSIPEVKLVSGNLDKVGSEVCIGEECFYIISSTSDSITMLAKYNLYVGGVYNNSGLTMYGDEATGLQDSTMLGVGPSTRRGVTAFSNKSNNYSGSIVEGYVNNYKNYFEKRGIFIESARLITKEELEALGCVTKNTSCSNASSWVYLTSYWTETAYDNDTVWYVHTAASFANDSYSVNNRFGVRPVITISKSNF